MAKKRAKKQAKKKTKGNAILAPEKYLDADEQAKLLRYLKERADLAEQRGSRRATMNDFMVTLLLRTGLRASELTGLNMADLPGGIGHSKPYVYVRSGKGDKARGIIVGPKLTVSIRRYAATFRSAAKPGEPVFIAEGSGRRLGYMSVYSKIVGLMDRAGLGHKSPHCLRHTFGVNTYAATKDIVFVKEQMGHSSLASTMIYVKTLADKAKEYAALCEDGL